MAEIQGCDIPEDLYYDIENNVWVRKESIESTGNEEGEVVSVGMTDPAQTLSGRILFVRPKRAGTYVARGKSLASLESGKWAGPLVCPLSGTILETNDILKDQPALLNIDPYGTAWIAKLKIDPHQDWGHLVTGEEALTRYREKIVRDKIQCMRCS
ncbi:glycine cleavage system H protein [Sulfobacillus thermosulfidooxidans DSM 9293]|uniref:Glycine cleavage system H protein n=1 Tax=Sulfobacillus thermosulfidooxidans (strain DSM 9293 / VKM B-1269 / AT-1) TaxID=929705 RepID=A0A1W1WAJ4_SULTA|nr:glycine cleavage system protein H [Sulfobacillus thermosulfidooxidans]SMC03321.1 glycine cleavage system H protein [Sulfobacillus thermosulfidooxidans DSM 9293]